MATENKISLISPLSFEAQINELLEGETDRVAEALSLAQVKFGSPDLDLEPEEFERQRQQLLSIQRRAGLTYLRNGQFVDGLELLAATNIDPREIIALFSGLLPASSEYKSTLSATEIAKIMLAVSSTDKMTGAKKALVDFLLVIKSDHVLPAWASDIDTTLATLYAELNGPKLIQLVADEHHCVLADLSDVLVRYNRHHVLAMLHLKNKETRTALEIWKRLHAQGSGTPLSDPEYPGLDFVIDVLTKVQDPDLVYAFLMF